MTPAIKFLKRKDGVKIAYTTFGKGPYLVYTPPWVSNLSYIFEDPFQYRFFEQLSREVTVVLYDKHGCGQSDRNIDYLSAVAAVVGFCVPRGKHALDSSEGDPPGTGHLLYRHFKRAVFAAFGTVGALVQLYGAGYHVRAARHRQSGVDEKGGSLNALAANS